MIKIILAGLLFSVIGSSALASNDYLIKLEPGAVEGMLTQLANLETRGAKVEAISDSWIRIDASKMKKTFNLEVLKNDPSVLAVQPNYRVKLLENYQVQDPLRRAALVRGWKKQGFMRPPPVPDNPEIPLAPTQGSGADPLFSKQWGMLDTGVQEAWKITLGNPNMIVAVIDTGVDYTHEDLLPNLWRNEKEIPGNGIDDDNNGYVDDTIGWDFVSNDAKPFDFAVDPLDLIMGGGNPGHGTHCAGNVAARGGNGLGIAGVAPNVKIMSIRFLSEKGQGTTADAVKSILYAVNNGARILSNSWGSEGEDPADAVGNQALRDAVQYAQDKGALFIAAAGNGHNGVGYNNDIDAKPAFPASYDHDIILSVAALDSKNELGSFSNWGLKTVDIGAPGVAVFSTTVGGKYSDLVLSIGGFEVTWDGTSMATPHVAGAAALYWSANPTKSWREVKEAILDSAKKIPSLTGKAVSEGKLDVKALLN